jgi:hypothetical protein
MDLQKVEENIREQQKLGHPRFKNAIALELSSKFNIELSISQDILFSTHVHNILTDDINWAQHMGVDYWATRIFETVINKPKEE